jgi:hypothetical protein
VPLPTLNTGVVESSNGSDTVIADGGVGVGVTMAPGGVGAGAVGGGTTGTFGGTTTGTVGVGVRVGSGFGMAAARTTAFSFVFEAATVGDGFAVAIVRRGVTPDARCEGGVEWVRTAFGEGVFRGAGADFFAGGFGNAELGDADTDGSMTGSALAQ